MLGFVCTRVWVLVEARGRRHVPSVYCETRPLSKPLDRLTPPPSTESTDAHKRSKLRSSCLCGTLLARPSLQRASHCIFFWGTEDWAQSPHMLGRYTLLFMYDKSDSRLNSRGYGGKGQWHPYPDTVPVCGVRKKLWPALSSG